jgi:hypothetical protein
MEDPSFRGIAVGCGQVCHVHKMEPMKCVAFEGINTGRKFYLCPVENVSKFICPIHHLLSPSFVVIENDYELLA